MINTDELRRHNLIGYMGKVYAIEGLNKSSVFINDMIIDSKVIDAIPLTPEWLERCGFVRGSSYIGIGYHWDGPNEISIVQQQVDNEDTYRLYGSEWTIGKDFKYLHQLQNLFFALTGEELTINNEHIQSTSCRSLC